MSAWRVDRPATNGNHTEWFDTHKDATEHAAALTRSGVQCLAWWDAESVGPWVQLGGAA